MGDRHGRRPEDRRDSDSSDGMRNADAKAAVCRATEVKGRNQYPVWALELGGLLFLKCLSVHAEPQAI
jgi:hypothetical protein